MTMTEPAQERELAAEVERVHRAALAVLDDPDESSLGAVAWLSVHLAAVDQVVYRQVERVVPDGAARVTAQLRADHLLVQALWRLDRRLTGDVHHRSASLQDLEQDVRELLTLHAAGERGLLQALAQALPEQELQDLVPHLDKTMLRCPTRPHPDVPRLRRTAAAVSWVEGLVDRARDLMDSRPVPTPRPEPVLPRVTRWGTYGTAGTCRPSPVQQQGQRQDAPQP